MKKTILSIILLITTINIIYSQTNIYPSSGNVGIGTVLPEAPLHIEKNGVLLKLSNNSTNYAYTGIDALGLYLEQVADTPNKSQIRLQTRNSNSGSYSQFFIDGANSRFNFINGNVGIGTSTPSNKLDIRSATDNLYTVASFSNLINGLGAVNKGTAITLGYSPTEYFTKIATVYENNNPSYINPGLAFFTMYNTYLAGTEVERMRISSNGNVGIGTTSPDKLLTLKTDSTLGWEYTNNGSGSYHTITGGGINPMSFTVSPFSDPNGAIFKFNGNSGTKVTMLNGGNVGIGTITPAYKLDVCGTIRANEIKVDLTGICVPDFVFKKDYKLMSLNDLENFVTTKQHLPELASEKEMLEDGLNMKEFQMKLLQKVEELTLYTIQQNKKNEKQEEELKILKAKIEKLESNKR